MQEDKYNQIVSIGEECIEKDELRELLKTEKELVVYDGFEPSGLIHIAQGLMRVIHINKLLNSGCKFRFIFWVADIYAKLNHKFGGNMNKIEKAGKLMIETWKALGMDMRNVEFIWANKEIESKSSEYWKIVLDISARNNLQRILRCTQIMGREENDNLTGSQIMYPMMQVADILLLNVDICSLGMDQRKVNVLCREYCKEVGRKKVPIILSHHMIMGLDGSTKMSKSNPDNAIFMHDSESEVNRKIKKGYCPPGDIKNNPIIEYTEYIIFEMDKRINIERIEKYGGNKIYISIEELKKDYEEEKLYPTDLKNAVAKAINRYLEPVRKYFANNESAKKLLDDVKKMKK